MKHTLTLSLAYFLIFACACWAYEPAGVKIQGMGGAGVALPEGAATVYWNPAGLYFNDRIGADLTFGFDDFDYPGSWGLSYLNYSTSERRGAGFGVYRIKKALVSEEGDAVAALLSTVYRTPVGLPLGLSFKYINERWTDQGRKNYFSLDLGFYVPFGGWLWSCSFQSVTSPDSRIFPYRALLGTSWGLQKTMTLILQVAADRWETLENPDQADLRAGLNWLTSKALSIQGGWAKNPAEKYWTGGIDLSNMGYTHLSIAYHWHPEERDRDRLFVGYSYSSR